MSTGMKFLCCALLGISTAAIAQSPVNGSANSTVVTGGSGSVTQINGAVVPGSATVLGSNAEKQLVPVGSGDGDYAATTPGLGTTANNAVCTDGVGDVIPCSSAIFPDSVKVNSACPSPTSGIEAIALQGVQNAACFAGSDWVAQVTAAMAALPSQGGTVFVPSAMQGTSNTVLNIPSNVGLVFDAGTFALANAITFIGQHSSIKGAGMEATILQFTGATHGIVFAAETPIVSYDRIEDIDIQTTNAAAQDAIHASAAVPGAVTHLDWRSVLISVSGSGLWAHGIFESNLQHTIGYGITIASAAAIGLHADTAGGNETHLYNLRIEGGSSTNRGFEITTPEPSSQEFWIDGGTLEGNFNQSAIYATVGEIHVSGLHAENTNASPSDGADVVLTGGVMFHAVNTQIGSLETINSSGAPTLMIVSSQVEESMTIADGTIGTIMGCNLPSTINDQSTVDYTSSGYLAWLGNRNVTGAMLANKLLGYFVSGNTAAIPSFSRNQDSDVSLSGLTLNNGLRLMSLNASASGILPLLWADSSNNTNIGNSTGALNINGGSASVSSNGAGAFSSLSSSGVASFNSLSIGSGNASVSASGAASFSGSVSAAQGVTVGSNGYGTVTADQITSPTQLSFSTNGSNTASWYMDAAAGNLIPNADNTVDVGQIAKAPNTVVTHVLDFMNSGGTGNAFATIQAPALGADTTLTLPLASGTFSLTSQLPLAGTTASWNNGGTAIAANSCVNGPTANVPGATSSMSISVTPSGNPGLGLTWNNSYISSGTTVQVVVCNVTTAAITPTAQTYNVRVIQ